MNTRHFALQSVTTGRMLALVTAQTPIMYALDSGYRLIEIPRAAFPMLDRIWDRLSVAARREIIEALTAEEEAA